MTEEGRCSFVCVRGRRAGGRPLVWSGLGRVTEPSVSSARDDKRRGISPVTIWLVAFQLPICLCDAHSAELTRVTVTHAPRTHSREEGINAKRERGRNWQPADGRLQRQ